MVRALIRSAALFLPNEKTPAYPTFLLFLSTLLSLSTPAFAAPPAGGIRAPFAEGYMYNYYVPPRASTPWRPAWSPDSKQIAFSMAGSIWRMRLGEPVAYELTANRSYDSSPAWSPDGRWLAYTTEDGHGVNLMLLNLATGESVALTSGSNLNLDPAFSPDGKRLAFVRNEPERQFHIYSMPIENGHAGEPVRLTEPHSFGHPRLYFGTFDDHIQPAWSPDGKELLLVSNRGISLGSGAIWRAKVEPDLMRDARMVLREETLYRTEPQWSPEGKRILYSSHRGSQFNNLYLLPVDGGEPYQFTHGHWDHFDARWSPDGEWIAYISNQRGVSELRLLRVVGGEDRPVEIRNRIYRRPMGKLEVYLREAATGQAAAARVFLLASDGKTYVPTDSFQRIPMHPDKGDYFHADKHFVVDVPTGEVTVEAAKGIEYFPVSKTVTVESNMVTEMDLDMRRMIHMNALGWYSGTGHTHMNYGGNLHNTPENMMMMARAEDLDVISDLVANKDNRVLDWQFFTGAPDKLSTPDRILIFCQEYRPPFYGHINLLNLTEHLITPNTTGYEQTAIGSLYPSNTDIFRVAHAEGAIGGYAHPWSEDPVKAGYAVARGFPVDLALGTSDYLEVLNTASHYTYTTVVWHRALNCGYKIPASAGEDSILSGQSTPVLGMSRMYAYLGSKLSWPGFIDAIRQGRTFVTNGPLLEFEVNGQPIGSEIHLPAGGGSVEISAQFHSVVPIDRMEVFYNGAVIETAQPAKGGLEGSIHKRFPVTRSGWLTFRAISAEGHLPVDDLYVVGETNPVFVHCGDQLIRSRADAEYFVQWIDGITGQAEADPGWRSDSERKHVLDQFAEAKRIFEQRAREAQ